MTEVISLSNGGFGHVGTWPIDEAGRADLAPLIQIFG
jgi:hypothetical protein